MGVEAIVRVVEAEAADEAARIVEAARARADGLVAAAEEDADTRIRAACGRAEPPIRAEATRAVNTARVQSLDHRAGQAAALVEAAMARASSDLENVVAARDSDRWRRALERLVMETAEGIGPGGVVRVRAEDLESADPIAAGAGCRVAPFDGDDPVAPLMAGAVGRSADGRIEIDSTLRTRLERARTELAEPVAHRLGVEA